jgi:hypothetical protein
LGEKAMQNHRGLERIDLPSRTLGHGSGLDQTSLQQRVERVRELKELWRRDAELKKQEAEHEIQTSKKATE